jgi:hypothetical protein
LDYKLNTQKIPNEENTVIQQHLGKYERLLPALALIFHLMDCASIGQHNDFGQVVLKPFKKPRLV